MTRRNAKHHNAIRRRLLQYSLGLGITGITTAACSQNKSGQSLWTPRQSEGPFYPVQPRADKDVDLTIIEGHSEQAKGEVIRVRGTVTDTSGNIIQNAFVEIWQANTWGRYRHPRDPNNAPIDPNFQGWGQTYTDEQGRYGFKTIMPGAYPAGPGWTRPPHIHFKAARDSYAPLTTQMYFPGQKLNDQDGILQHLSPAEQRMVISKRKFGNEDEPVYVFDIVLRHAR
ncbi:MAG: protocatechuate 3,4-dioxygenase [Gammaproteobacteria bacterium]|jgi:protocatechuate 3,4-dioxygenase beta subunit